MCALTFIVLVISTAEFCKGMLAMALQSLWLFGFNMKQYICERHKPSDPPIHAQRFSDR